MMENPERYRITSYNVCYTKLLRLCVVQLSPGDGSADVVQIAPGQPSAPNLVRLLTDPSVLKVFHFARFDLGVLQQAFGVMPGPVYCTKIASRLTSYNFV